MGRRENSHIECVPQNLPMNIHDKISTTNPSEVEASASKHSSVYEPIHHV